LVSRGFADIVVSVLVVGITLLSATMIYLWISATSSTVGSNETTYASKVLQIPPRIEAAVPTYDPDMNTLNVRLTLRSVSQVEENLVNYYITLRDSSGKVVSGTKVSCYLPPGGVCEVNASFPGVSRSGTYVLANSYPLTVNINVPRVQLRIISLSSDVRLSPPSNRYSGILFTGDFNSATLTVLLDNISDVDASGTITASGACIDSASVSYALPANQSKVFSIPINVTSTSSNCTITVSTTHSTNSDSVSVPVYFLDFCDSNSTCYDALQSAQSRDANTVVMLTADINVTTAPALGIPSGNYQDKVVFDGNGHLVRSASTPAIDFSSADNIHVSNMSISGSSCVIESTGLGAYRRAKIIFTNASFSANYDVICGNDFVSNTIFYGCNIRGSVDLGGFDSNYVFIGSNISKDSGGVIIFNGGTGVVHLIHSTLMGDMPLYSTYSSGVSVHLVDVNIYVPPPAYSGFKSFCNKGQVLCWHGARAGTTITTESVRIFDMEDNSFLGNWLSLRSPEDLSLLDDNTAMITIFSGDTTLDFNGFGLESPLPAPVQTYAPNITIRNLNASSLSASTLYVAEYERSDVNFEHCTFISKSADTRMGGVLRAYNSRIFFQDSNLLSNSVVFYPSNNGSPIPIYASAVYVYNSYLEANDYILYLTEPTTYYPISPIVLSDSKTKSPRFARAAGVFWRVYSQVSVMDTNIVVTDAIFDTGTGYYPDFRGDLNFTNVFVTVNDLNLSGFAYTVRSQADIDAISGVPIVQLFVHATEDLNFSPLGELEVPKNGVYIYGTSNVTLCCLRVNSASGSPITIDSENNINLRSLNVVSGQSPAIYMRSSTGVKVSDSNFHAYKAIVGAYGVSAQFQDVILSSNTPLEGIKVSSSCWDLHECINASDLNFVGTTLKGRIYLYAYNDYWRTTVLRFIHSTIDSSSYPAIYAASQDYTNIYLQDTNIITTTTPIYFGGNYYGTLEVNLSDANQWIYSPDTSDWYTPNDINIHIIAATDPPQYFLITDLNDVSGGGTVHVVCDFNTAITPEECAAIYVRNPS